jgi:hypothetical protein
MTGWRDYLKIHLAADVFPMMSPEELRELGEDIKKHRLQGRIKLLAEKAPDGPRYYVLDGRSRLDAMEMTGLPIQVFVGSTPNRNLFEVVEDHVDPWTFVVSANIRRRHLTGDQKRDLIAMLLKRQPEKSDRQVAATVGVHHSTVGSVRAGLEGRGEISHVETRTDTKGRQQPGSKSKPSAPAERKQTAADDAAPVPAQAAVRKFTPGETLTDIVWTIEALVGFIADTAPQEVVAESDSTALIKLARDAEVASAWLGALQVLAESAVRGTPNHPAGDADDNFSPPFHEDAARPQLDLFPHGGNTP